jgi:hypothetical protein
VRENGAAAEEKPARLKGGRYEGSRKFKGEARS